MSIRKFGAPASSHDRRITAEDVEATQGCPISEQQEDEKKDKDAESKEPD